VSLLTLSKSELKRWHDLALDLAARHRDLALSRPIARVGEPKELRTVLWEPLPRASTTIDRIFDKLNCVFDHTADLTHPRFFAFVPSPGNSVSSIADYLTSELNIFAGSWLEASGPAVIEELVIDWFTKLVGYASSAGGLFVSGGSMANLTALVTARTIKLGDDWQKGTIYFSDQTHSSIKRALKIMGFSTKQIRIVPTLENFQLSLAALTAQIESDKKEGMQPFCVVVNAGTTNTGSFDPILEVSELCRANNIWMHTDGAYGLPATFLPESKQSSGINRSDSISFDPHKWLFQNYSCGCLLVANKKHLLQTFSLNPEYLRDAEAEGEKINFWDYGPELTRPFRALKLWLSIEAFGWDAFLESIRKGCAMAGFVENLISARPDWEIVSPAQNAVICFKYKPSNLNQSQLDDLNGRIAKFMLEKGDALVLSTQLREKTVLRICPINPRLNQSDIEHTLQELFTCATDLHESIKAPL
jgi:aromatic-L-amino-acid/L-tryptophan decarboxylase